MGDDGVERARRLSCGWGVAASGFVFGRSQGGKGGGCILFYWGSARECVLMGVGI